ncbi:MAG: SpoIIE family protein phosphatase [Treponema sp.]|nr:SpoIIE family protein phosphatase [Treponema sp.]
MGTTRRTHRQNSLRRSFLAVILAVYAAVTVGSMLVFAWSAGSISERYATRFCISQGELQKEKILSLLDRDLALSRKLADDPTIVRWMLRENDPRRRELAFAQLESYRRFLRDGANFLAIKSSLSYYARTPVSTGVEKARLDPGNPADRWFFQAISANKDYSLNVDHNAMLGENRVWINVLVRSEDGTPIGIAGCGLDLTNFLATLLDNPERGVTTIIVDARGALQAYRDRDLIAHNAEAERDAEKIDVYSLVTRAADRDELRRGLGLAEAGKPVGVMSISFLGRRQLCSISSLPELGWYDLAIVDAGSVIGISDFVPVAIVTLAALAAVLAAVIAAANRLVVRPIGRLTEAAGLVAAGSYDIALPDGPRNEIGRLGASFRIMAEKVKVYTTGLESLVGERTRELRAANEDLEASRRRILDSIEYAKLIQDSIFPTEAELSSGFAGHFVMARQRDLVGGDFFFFRRTSDGFCAALADCTGHGVPGAFMTMLVKAHLDRVVDASEGRSESQAAPSALLRELDGLVTGSLGRESETAHLENGLDIALVRWKKEKSELWFSGAGLPLYLMQGGELAEIPGERTHLGFSQARRTRMFRDHRLVIEGEARACLVSDGVLDLPGGERGLPFGRSRLAALLKRSASLGFDRAGELIAAGLAGWQGARSQRDDFSLVYFGLDSRKEGR